MYNQFPYSGFNPNAFGTMQNTPSGGISSLLGLSKKTFNWDSFLNNAQRTLNVINQAMPIYNQVRPMFRNMGTIFKVIGELNSAPTTIATTSATTQAATAASAVSSAPQFFV